MSAARGRRLRTWARQARQAWMQVCGIPDYERYLAHRAARHPDEPVLSRGEFFARAIDRKYRRSGPRCC
ncbi:MAG TPA: YbdD/YjiX family protein [Casimicrobiaceae bacterium]